MAKLPEDIKERITSLSKRAGVKPQKLVAELKQIIDSDETIQSMSKPEQKIRLASGILMGRYTSKRKMVDMYIRPIFHPRPRKVKVKGENKHNCHFACIACVIDEENEEQGPPKLAAGTLWESAAKNTENLNPKKVYKTALAMSEEDNGYEITANEATYEEVKDIKIPSALQYYKKFIEPNEDDFTVNLAELKLNSKDNDVDFRIIEVSVMDHPVGIGSDKQEYGYYSVTDNSLLEEEEEEGRFPVWMHPLDIDTEKGSLIKIIGTSSYDKEQKKVRWDNFFTIDVDAIRITGKPGKKEEVDAGELLDDDFGDDDGEDGDDGSDDVLDEISV